jgi:hypothetical protein
MRSASPARVKHPCKGSSARGARGRILFEGGQERFDQAFGKLGAPLARVGRRLGQVREADLGDSASGERRLARDALVEHAAERVDVARARRFLSLDQLGREVVRGAEQLALGGEPGRVGAPRQAEVGERCDALAVEEDVRRLDVPVQDVARVQGVESAAELRGELDCLLGSERPERAQSERQGAPLVERHREIGAAA